MMPAPLPANTGLDPRSRRYTPTWSDGLGERLLVFDPATATSLEILKFRREFADQPDFEVALRRRVVELGSLRHPSLSIIRAVEWLDGGDGLALVSHHVAGRRLSEILHNARGAAFALEFIRQVTPAVYALQQVRPGIAHGLLSADRVVVTREGRLVVVEYPIGPALESLHLSADYFRNDLGLALPNLREPIGLDQRLDVLQLGFIALSLLLGRRVNPMEFRDGIPALLEETQTLAPLSVKLRPWLERALQMTERPFESAQDALEAIEDLPHDLRADVDEAPRAVLAFRPPVEGVTPVPESSAAPVARVEVAPVASMPPPVPPTGALRVAADSVVVPAQVVAPAPVVASVPVAAAASTVAPVADVPEPVEPPVPPAPVRVVVRQDVPRVSPAEHPSPISEHAAPVRPKGTVFKWAAVAMAVAACAEGVVIAGLLSGPKTTVPSITIAPPVAVTAASLRLGDAAAPAVAPPAVVEGLAAPAAVKADNTVAPAAPAAPAPAPAAPTGKFGGVKVTAPVELQVSEGGTVLGSSAGPIALSEGTHTLDVVNESLGFRSKQTVTVKPGQMTAVPIALPQGRMNINAAPWASVWVDGSAAGDTPLANVSIPIGVHEILFRHPQLGEQRLTAIVKADGVTRVSASFQR